LVVEGYLMALAMRGDGLKGPGVAPACCGWERKLEEHETRKRINNTSSLERSFRFGYHYGNEFLLAHVSSNNKSS
jgi:hypothetical protein